MGTRPASEDAPQGALDARAGTHGNACTQQSAPPAICYKNTNSANCTYTHAARAVPYAEISS